MARILEEGFSESMGARELRRAITRIVDDALSDAMLAGAVRAGDTALLDCEAGGGGPVRVINRSRGPAGAAEQEEVAYSSAWA